MKHHRGQKNVDNYDGHVLESSYEYEGAELTHDVIHPPTCHEIDRGNGWIEHDCAVTFVLGSLTPQECFEEAKTPGHRIIGWRHETYGGTWTPMEHDVIAFCLPDTIEVPTTAG